MRRTVGRIGRAHGVRGAVAVEVRTDEPDRRFAVGQRLHVEAPDNAVGPDRLPATLEISGAVWHSGRLIVTFTGVGDRTAAEVLRGALLEVQVDPARGPDDDGQWYDHQLVGLAAVTAEGTACGTVTSVLHLPGQDCLEIQHEGATHLVPFVEAIVPVVDLVAGRIVIDAPPGLLDDQSGRPAAD